MWPPGCAKTPRRWEVRSAGHGSKGERWYAWALVATASSRAVTAALLRDRTDSQAPSPARPDQPPPVDPGMIPLTVPEITRLLAVRPAAPGHVGHWSNWRRRHQALACWYYQRARLARDAEIALAG